MSLDNRGSNSLLKRLRAAMQLRRSPQSPLKVAPVFGSWKSGPGCGQSERSLICGILLISFEGVTVYATKFRLSVLAA